MAGRNEEEKLEDSPEIFPECNLSSANAIDSEISDSSQLLSLPTQPPDIRNWFSSYETPDLDVGDDLDSCIFEEIDIEKREKFEQFEKIVERDRDFQLNALFSRRISEDGTLQGTSLQKHDYVSLNKKEGSRLDDKVSLGSLNDQRSIISSTANEISKNGNGKSPKAHPSSDRDDQVEGKICSNGFITPKGVNRGSPKKSFTRSNHMEETEVFLKRDGFTSTKKRENKGTGSENHAILRKNQKDTLTEKSSYKICFLGTDENSREVGIDNDRQIEFVGNAGLVLGKKDGKRVLQERDHGHVKTMVLSDRTNFFQEGVAENSGKWLCPQRNKPYRGPPLKQLRLERWVHRLP